jgi:hypothetical protein
VYLSITKMCKARPVVVSKGRNKREHTFFRCVVQTSKQLFRDTVVFVRPKFMNAITAPIIFRNE